MLPIGDDNRGRRSFPVVNLGLIALNALVFVYELSLPTSGLDRFIRTYGAVPAAITHGVPAVVDSPVPAWATVFTAMFIHAGWLHILGNMLFLWIFGDNVEDAMGHVRYLVFYLIGGVAAALAQTYIGGPLSTDPMIGASGAIAAVLAAYLVLFPRGGVRVLVFLGFFVTVLMVPAVIVIGIWFATQFLNGLASLGVATQQTAGIAFWAHVGGFGSGLVLVWLFRDRAAVERQRLARQGYRVFQRR